jgi:hypothetical protein
MSLAAVNLPKYASVLNRGVGVLGTGASTVGATAIGVDGSAADAKVCYTAGAFGGICESIIVSTDNSAALVGIIVYILDVATVNPLGTVSVPLSSGSTAAAPAADIINGLPGLPINSVYKKYIPLKANQTIKIASVSALTANKYIWVSTSGVDFVA